MEVAVRIGLTPGVVLGWAGDEPIHTPFSIFAIRMSKFYGENMFTIFAIRMSKFDIKNGEILCFAIFAIKKSNFDDENGQKFD